MVACAALLRPAGRARGLLSRPRARRRRRPEVDTALIVAVDVSNSVDEQRYRLADGGDRPGARGSRRHPGDRRRRQGRHPVLHDHLGRPSQGQPAVDAHHECRGGARHGQARARAAAPGRRIHLHVAHDALRLRQDRPADPGQGRQGGARHLGRRPRQLQRGGADRRGARRARQVRRDGQRPAHPGGHGRMVAEAPGGVSTQSYLPGEQKDAAARGLVPRRTSRAAPAPSCCPPTATPTSAARSARSSCSR